MLRNSHPESEQDEDRTFTSKSLQPPSQSQADWNYSPEALAAATDSPIHGRTRETALVAPPRTPISNKMKKSEETNMKKKRTAVKLAMVKYLEPKWLR